MSSPRNVGFVGEQQTSRPRDKVSKKNTQTGSLSDTKGKSRCVATTCKIGLAVAAIGCIAVSILGMLQVISSLHAGVPILGLSALGAASGFVLLKKNENRRAEIVTLLATAAICSILAILATAGLMTATQLGAGVLVTSIALLTLYGGYCCLRSCMNKHGITRVGENSKSELSEIGAIATGHVLGRK